MMTGTGMVGVRISGRVEFNPLKNILGRTTIPCLPHVAGREVVRKAPYKAI
jgi:hypothetical protein